MYDVAGSLLVTGRRTDCGRENHSRNYVAADISGKKFNRLTALYPTDERDKKGSVIWVCRCDCGNEINISHNALVYSNIRSCGCLKKEHNEKLTEYLTHIAGTSIDMIKSKKVPTDNTTGHEGVYLINGKYVAKIVFQKKQYYLGAYDNINDAVDARNEAEEILFDGLARYYEKYKQRADADPEWAEDNPVRVIVSRKLTNGIDVSFYPAI
ncbi:MAG: hypothetical protein E7218_00475 [Anaerofustis stercorihominis]|nr:hypothetical protein [Anaerofustis stercorihominis]